MEKDLKQYKPVVNNLAGKQVIITDKNKMPELYENAKDLKLEKSNEAERLKKFFSKSLDNKFKSATIEEWL